VNAFEVVENIKKSVPLVIIYSLLISNNSCEDITVGFLFSYLNNVLPFVKCVLFSLHKDVIHQKI